MEPFKERLNAGVVRALGGHLARAWPAFPRERFEQRATQGLHALELKARAQHIAAALDDTLPARFAELAAVLERSLAPARDPGAGTVDAGPDADGLTGWSIWPLCEVVERRGLDEPARALRTLHALTQRFTAEWAVRVFIERHPATTYATLRRWTRDPSPHVRRLVSEGTRPRLPWGRQLQALIADPTPNLELLVALQDDPSDYVRRSVANHLNDIAKDHPQVVVDWVRAHLPGAGERRRMLLRHASRTLIKQGHAGMLALWGAARAFDGAARLSLAPPRVSLGDTLTLSVELRSRSVEPQRLVVDYAVHHVKANGTRTPKVFKGWQLTLGPGEVRTLRKAHPLRRVTTRRYHAGRHEVDLRVNGGVVAKRGFELRLA